MIMVCTNAEPVRGESAPGGRLRSGVPPRRCGPARRRRSGRHEATGTTLEQRSEPHGRGAALVEAAIILPLMMTLAFGAIEYGLAFKESATVAQAARAGARIGSTMPRNDGYLAAARDAVTTAVSGLGHATPEELWVYKVAPGTDDSPIGGACATDCVVYEWNPATEQFGPAYTGDPWLGSEQNACIVSGDASVPERVGVQVTARHSFVTALFGGSRTLKSRAVMRLEPYVGEGACKP